MSEDSAEGRIIWVDLTTPDPQRAKAFYGAVFGWEYAEQDRGADGFYRVVSVGGQGFGGMLSMAEIGNPDDDVPAHWMPYFYTEQVQQVTDRAAELGATVYMPMREISGVCRFSVIGGPQMDTFAPMQPLMEGDPPPDIPPVGGPIWYELVAPDQKAGAKFYTDLFGLTTASAPMPDGEYLLLKQSGRDIAGVLQAPPDMPVAGWCPYFRIDDIEAARLRITEHGGQNLTDVMTVPDTGDISVAIDPVGAVFGMLVPSWV